MVNISRYDKPFDRRTFPPWNDFSLAMWSQADILP